jgi:RNA polymerase sigma-70 factor (ECF subfamily)
LQLVDELGLSNYYLFHAVRGELLGRLGRKSEAAAAYRGAMEKCGNAREREFLGKKMQEMTAGE